MEFLTSLDNYIIFYEVAKCKNITKSSENLFISQPAVSQTLKKMEENLGVSLFARSRKGMELTPVGKKIFEKVELALRNLSAIEQLIDEEKGLLRGELVIGAGSNVARKVLCKPIAAFVLDYPLVDIRIVEGVQVKMIEALKSGEINFVLTQFNEKINLPFEAVFETQYCFVKSANCEADRFVMLTDGSYTHQLFKEFIEKINLSWQTMEVAGYKTALEIVRLGIGTTLVPRYIVQEELEAGELVEVFGDYDLPKVLFGIYYNDALSTPASKVFLEYLKD